MLTAQYFGGLGDLGLAEVAYYNGPGIAIIHQFMAEYARKHDANPKFIPTPSDIKYGKDEWGDDASINTLIALFNIIEDIIKNSTTAVTGISGFDKVTSYAKKVTDAIDWAKDTKIVGDFISKIFDEPYMDSYYLRLAMDMGTSDCVGDPSSVCAKFNGYIIDALQFLDDNAVTMTAAFNLITAMQTGAGSAGGLPAALANLEAITDYSTVNKFSRYNTTRGVYVIYKRKAITPLTSEQVSTIRAATSKLAFKAKGLGCGCTPASLGCGCTPTLGCCTPLAGNDPAVVPAIPDGFEKESEQGSQPDQAVAPYGGEEHDAFWSTSNKWMWIALGGGALLIGGITTAIILKRRKRLSA